MATDLDVYRDWLGIEIADRPLNYYQLLRLKKFEDDPARIRSHYRKMNAHVRKYAAGDFAQQSQDLLNELARAMLCLTDMSRKEEYDASMGRAEKGPRKRRTFEQLLVARQVVTQEQLQKAQNYANAVGLDMRDAVVQQKFTRPEISMQIYAEAEGLPFVELADVGLDEEWVPKVPNLIARQHSCAPVMVDDGTLLMASPNLLRPDIEEELRLRLGMPVRTVICTVAEINQVIAEHFPKTAASDAPPVPSATAGSDDAEDEEPAEKGSEDEFKQRRMLVTVVAYLGTLLTLFLVAQLGIFIAVAGGAAVAGIVYGILGMFKP